MSNYRVVVNFEVTSKCNARCAMCPRTMMQGQQTMDMDLFRQTLSRLDPAQVFRVILAGYGEPTSHPKFNEMLGDIKNHPAIFDLATNGSLLNEERLRLIDGVLRHVMISFSSVDPEVYKKVHAGLDQSRVLANIVAARDILKNTRMSVSLSPTIECLDTLEQTINWMLDHGISDLTMSPTYYDRAGAHNEDGPSMERLRGMIRKYGLKSQEYSFIPSAGDIVGQWWSNSNKCVARNTNMLINASGEYTFCFNDIRHSHTLGNVRDLSLAEALAKREAMGTLEDLCGKCNLRERYRPAELARVAVGYFKTRLAAA